MTNENTILPDNIKKEFTNAELETLKAEGVEGHIIIEAIKAKRKAARLW
jgi:hypothetical protein